MSVSVISFLNAKIALKEQKEREKNYFIREKTQKFAFEVNNLVSNYDIDPVHQATLLMAKAIDVLVTAGPVPSNLDEQHARAKNLLQSVIRARTDLMEKSVRIVSPKETNLKKVGDDL